MSGPFWQSRRARVPEGHDLPERQDFVVVGGGLLGCSSAYWLRRARPDATISILEMRRLAFGASGRNAGFVIQGSAANYATDVERFGRAVARRLWSETLRSRDAMFRELPREAYSGASVGARTVAGTLDEDQALRDSAELLREDGFDARYEDAGDTADALGSVGFFGSLVVPTGAMVDPVGLVEAIADASTSQIVTGCEVVRVWQGGDGVLIETARGTVTATAAVVALGAYLPLVVPELTSLVKPVRAQMFATRPAPGGLLEQPVYSHDGYFYVRQAPMGEILVGGARHLHEATEVGYLHGVTHALQADLEAYLARHFPRLAGHPVAHRWSGVMGFSQDHLPVVDELPGVPGSWFVTGLTGHGLSIGFRLAELIAQAITGSGRPGELELELFAASRLSTDTGRASGSVGDRADGSGT